MIDSVDRQLLWACCKRAGISDLVIRMLSGMFDHNMSRVVIDGCVGEWFPNSVGLMQGSSLSPFLYALFIDDLPLNLLSHFPSLPLGDSRINSILYADDIALISESVDIMQSMLDYCTEFGKERHLHWGTQKCEVLLSSISDLPCPLILQHEPLNICTKFKYLGIYFDKKGIDTDACVARLGESIGKAAVSLSGIGLKSQNYPLHIIASHFRAFVRSCGEYALAILPLTNAQIIRLERQQYRAIRLLIKSEARVSRLKLLACLSWVGLETMRLRFNILSAKWFHEVKHNKSPEFLVKQAYIDFSRSSSRMSHSSSFHHPCNNNPVIKRYLQSHLESSSPSPSTDIEYSRFAMACKASIDHYYATVLHQSQLPIPPRGYSIMKTLHSLGIPRNRLRFVLMWLCNCVPYAGRECAKCKQEISKAHLESCVLQSSLPNAEPGKRIDNLLFKAVSMLHAPSALLAVNILYDEITHASLFLASKHLTIGLNTIIILLCVDPCSQSSL